MVNTHQISKFLTLILRHKPQILGLEIDNDGFCSATLPELVALMNKQPKFKDVIVQDIINTVSEDKKGRYQIVDDKIRALYGHSVPVSLLKDEILTIDQVPELLYHGTTKKNIDSIFSIGLIGKNRVYVHLSANIDKAMTVGKRHSPNPVIIRINAKELVKDGHPVKKVGNETYISNTIDPKYLTIL